MNALLYYFLIIVCLFLNKLLAENRMHTKFNLKLNIFKKELLKFINKNCSDRGKTFDIYFCMIQVYSTYTEITITFSQCTKFLQKYFASLSLEYLIDRGNAAVLLKRPQTADRNEIEEGRRVGREGK